MDLQVLVWSRRAFLRAVVASMFVVMNAMPVDRAGQCSQQHPWNGE